MFCVVKRIAASENSWVPGENSKNSNCRLPITVTDSNSLGINYDYRFGYSGQKKDSLQIKFMGRMFIGHHGPTRRNIVEPGPGMSRTNALCKAPSSVVLDRKLPGCPAIWVGTSRNPLDNKHFGTSALKPGRPENVKSNHD